MAHRGVRAVEVPARRRVVWRVAGSSGGARDDLIF